MLERVIVLGDSYSYGHGCSDRIYYVDMNTKEIIGRPFYEKPPSDYCWASLIKKEFNIEVINLARCGHSNPAMFRDLVNFGLNDKNKNLKTLLIYAGTSPDRLEVGGGSNNVYSWVLSQDPNFVHPEFVKNPEQEQHWQAKKMYIKNLYNSKIGQNIGLMSMLSCFQYAILCNFKFAFSITHYWYDSAVISHWYNSFADIKNLSFPDIQSFDYSGKGDPLANNKIYKCVDNHTNEKGHEIYYNLVIKPIISKYFYE